MLKVMRPPSGAYGLPCPVGDLCRAFRAVTAPRQSKSAQRKKGGRKYIPHGTGTSGIKKRVLLFSLFSPPLSRHRVVIHSLGTSSSFSSFRGRNSRSLEKKPILPPSALWDGKQKPHRHRRRRAAMQKMTHVDDAKGRRRLRLPAVGRSGGIFPLCPQENPNICLSRRDVIAILVRGRHFEFALFLCPINKFSLLLCGCGCGGNCVISEKLSSSSTPPLHFHIFPAGSLSPRRCYWL